MVQFSTFFVPNLGRYLGLLVCVLLPGCSLLQQAPATDLQREPLTQALIERNASVKLVASQGIVLTDNDEAFAKKLALIESATETIDLAYYIFSNDYSSSALSQALLDATKRGVNVRLLVDYHSSYKQLDFFAMLEQATSNAPGRLEVRFYNRPTPWIVRDAAYLTMGCGEENRKEADCTANKFAQIEAELADGTNGLNANVANSGLFLSGLYGKNPSIMAMAVTEGQQLDPSQLKAGNASADEAKVAKLKELAKIYWKANYSSGGDRLVNRLKLNLAFLFYGEDVHPVYNTFASFLPVERAQMQEQARQDWRFLTDFLHHKFLLADEKHFVLGGRNIEDSYHMQSNPLSSKYTFMDTDVYLALTDKQPRLRTTFDRLWEFPMVATLAEVRQHAPNDFLVASNSAAKHCEQTIAHSDKEGHQQCLAQQLPVHQRKSLKVRFNQQLTSLKQSAATFYERYQPEPSSSMPSPFIDPQAEIYYIENLPFQYDESGQVLGRSYGAENGQESQSGKHIHMLWLAALKSVCEQASAETPMSVILHNAYFFMSSNLLSQIAQMIDGRQECAHVSITILTNSIETTDLNIVNVLSQHSVKALFEHYQTHGNRDRGASLHYYEYVLPEDTNTASRESLHSKVMVIGRELFIGSANADVRSFMMDSNNGLLIRRAPNLLNEYRRWLFAKIADTKQTQIKNNDYLTTRHSQWLDRGDDFIDATMARYDGDRFVNPEQLKELKQQLRAISLEIYTLSQSIVSHHGKSKEAQQRFNQLFKAI